METKYVTNSLLPKNKVSAAAATYYILKKYFI
jgi:hypothetical protein